MKRYDVAVIGSGAGLMVLEAALNWGGSCAIVEKSKFGGTCLTKGCIPSKMLAYPADLIREAQNAKRIGLNFMQPEVDWEKISDRMWRQIGHCELIEKQLLHTEGLTVYKGTGEFTGPNTMKVSLNGGGEEEFEAERFIIASGARSFVPEVEGLNEVGYVVSETFFGEKFPKKPWKSLIILGGGPIGAEFAHIFSALGTKVTILQSGEHLIRTEEEEISEFVRRQFEKLGIGVYTNVRALSAGRSGENKTLTYEDKSTGERRTAEGEEILIAAGVRSTGSALRLDKADIRVDKKGWIVTNEFLETSRKNIWALGDINGKYLFRHKANYEAEILINNIFRNSREKKRACYNAVPWAIYTYPQVAHVGMTEREARDAGIRYYVGKNYYSEVVGGIKMGYSRGDDDGFVKLIVGDDKKIIGVHIVGPHAPILLQPFVYLMNAGHRCPDNEKKRSPQSEIKELRIMCPPLGTYTPIADSMVIHPSLSELTAWALDKIDWN